MIVQILSKANFQRFMELYGITDDNVETQDMLIVSINQPHLGEGWEGWGDEKSYFKRQHSNVMIMHFPDVGDNFYLNEKWEYDPRMFTEYKAKKLVEFIKRNKDKSLAVVHCLAGISRSGAVGSFIHDLYGTESYEQFKARNPQIYPNARVSRFLNGLINDYHDK